MSEDLDFNYEQWLNDVDNSPERVPGDLGSYVDPAEYVSPEQSFADKLLEKAKTFDGRVVSILVAALGIHVSTLMLTGFPLAKGGYEKGEGLRTGAGKFQDVSADLGSAGSDPGWQGPAAQSYDARNTEQQTRTDQMAALDTQLATLLQTQAAEVEKLRKDMLIVLYTLLSAKLIAMMLYKTPAVGPQLSTTYQLATAGACLTTTTGLLSAQRVRSNKTGAALNNVAESYSHIADAAQAARPLHS